jgi:DNA-binding NtrC family response regulator
VNSPRTILVVDETATLRQIMVRALDGVGYKTLVAASGADALRILERGGAPIDLVITDFHLGTGMSGVGLAIGVQTQRPGVPVLLMSGEHSHRGAAEYFLEKPFTMVDLVGAVEAIFLDRSGEGVAS